MTTNERTGELRTQTRRRFLHHLTLLAGGVLFAPLFARAATTKAATIQSTRKSGRVIAFPGSDANALAAQVDALGYDWMPVADQAAAHAAVTGRETIAVIGTGPGVAAALRFARNHAGVKAVLIMGTDHDDALDEFHALQAPRGYAVQIFGAIETVDWHGAGRWLDQHMA